MRGGDAGAGSRAGEGLSPAPETGPSVSRLPPTRGECLVCDGFGGSAIVGTQRACGPTNLSVFFFAREEETSDRESQGGMISG